MKKNDLIAIVVIGVIFAVIGVVLVGRFGGQSGGRTAEVEVVQQYNSEFNEEAKQLLKSDEIDNFTVRVDLSQGIGNTRPFGN